MAKYEGFIGKLNKTIFNDNAKGATKQIERKSFNISYTPYKLTSNLASFTGAGAVAGGIATSSITLGENYLNDKKPTDNLTSSVLRGLAAGAATGAAINVIPKMLSNQLARSGVSKLDADVEAATNEFLRIVSPVISEFDTKGVKKEGTESVDKIFRRRWKEAGKAIQGDASPGEQSFLMYHGLIRDMKPETVFDKLKETKGKSKDITADQLIRFERLNQNFNQMTNDLSKFWDSPDASEIKQWYKTSYKRFQQMNRLDKTTVGANYLTQLGFDSTYNHIISPTRDFFSNIRKGNLKGINLEQIGATVFSGYGLYESGLILNDVKEGDWGGVATGALSLALGKLAYSAGVEAIKFDAKRRAAGISYSSMWRAGLTYNDMRNWSTDSLKVSSGQYRNLQRSIQDKALDILKHNAPATGDALSTMENLLRSEAIGPSNVSSLFEQGLEAFKSGRVVEGVFKDLETKGKQDLVNSAKTRFEYYAQNYASDIMETHAELSRYGLSSLRGFETRYSNLYNDLHKDIIAENKTIDFDKFTRTLAYGRTEDKINEVKSLVYNTKIIQDRANNSLPELKTYTYKKKKKDDGGVV